MHSKPVFAVVGAVVLSTVAGCGSGTSDASVSGVQPSTVPTLDDTSMPPWPAPTDVPALVAEAGLDLGPMGTAEHYHPRLRIIVDGEAVPVPPNIGVDPTTGAMSALHTHEGDGTIHIEADTRGEVFTLGQLFTQWGVRLTESQIGGVQPDKGQELTLSSNGQIVDGNPNQLQLEPEQQIVLTVG